MTELHPDLQRYHRLAVVGGAVVAALGAIMVAGGVVEMPVVSEVPALVLIVFGAAFLVFGYLGLVLAPRWYRDASRIVATGRPVTARVTLKREQDSESTWLRARVHTGAASAAARGEISLLVPRWDVAALLDSPIQVELHVDTVRNRVVALATERGLLWSIPYYRWAEREV